MSEQLYGPADTNDPNVRVSSTKPQFTPEATKNGLPVKAVTELPPVVKPEPVSQGRIDTYVTRGPGLSQYRITRDLDTGEETAERIEDVPPPATDH